MIYILDVSIFLYMPPRELRLTSFNDIREDNFPKFNENIQPGIKKKKEDIFRGTRQEVSRSTFIKHSRIHISFLGSFWNSKPSIEFSD